MRTGLSKKNKSLLVAIACCFLLLASVGTTSYAWFAASRTATVNFTNVQATGPGIASLAWGLYKDDGTYLTADGYKNADGTASSGTFNMNQFDRLIPDKNEVANLIMKIDVTLEAAYSLTDYHLVVSALTSSLTFGEPTVSGGAIYRLSDVIAFKSLANPTGVDTSTSTLIHSTASTLFASETATGFISIASHVKDDAKTGQLDYSSALVADSTATTVYLNINYEETLIKSLYAIAVDSAYDSYEGSSITLASDFSFSVSLIGGAAS